MRMVRLVVHPFVLAVLHAMQDRDARLGVASLCIGGGQGIAMVVERG